MPPSDFNILTYNASGFTRTAVSDGGMVNDPYLKFTTNGTVACSQLLMRKQDGAVWGQNANGFEQNAEVDGYIKVTNSTTFKPMLVGRMQEVEGVLGGACYYAVLSTVGASGGIYRDSIYNNIQIPLTTKLLAVSLISDTNRIRLKLGIKNDADNNVVIGVLKEVGGGWEVIASYIDTSAQRVTGAGAWGVGFLITAAGITESGSFDVMQFSK